MTPPREQSRTATVDQDLLARWVADLTGTAIGPLRRISAGSSRAMYLVPMDGADPLVLRVDSGGGPVAGTELTLRREAELYRALADHAVRIPRFHGLHESGLAFLMDHAAGTHDLASLDEPARIAICDRFMEELAALHGVDTRTLDLPSFRRPAGPRAAALLELDLWQGILDDRLSGDLSLGRCAFSILRRLAPVYDGPWFLCHGDVGPKNFMFEDGRITAIIDWEQAHLGDPMDDLAWWMFRGHEWLGAAGSLPDQLRLWSARTGIALDRSRLIWYRALVLLRWYIEIRTGLANGGSSQDRISYLRLIPAIDVKLARALAQLIAVDLGPLPAIEAEDQLLGTEAIDAIRVDLVEHIIPALSDPEASRRATSALEYLTHLNAVDRHGGFIRAQDRADLALFFSAPADRSATSILSDAAVGGAEEQAALLRYAMRRGARLAHLWPTTLARSLAPEWTADEMGLTTRQQGSSDDA